MVLKENEREELWEMFQRFQELHQMIDKLENDMKGLRKERENLLSKLEGLRNDEKNFTKQLATKYGKGVVNEGFIAKQIQEMMKNEKT